MRAGCRYGQRMDSFTHYLVFDGEETVEIISPQDAAAVARNAGQSTIVGVNMGAAGNIHTTLGLDFQPVENEDAVRLTAEQRSTLIHRFGVDPSTVSADDVSPAGRVYVASSEDGDNVGYLIDLDGSYELDS